MVKEANTYPISTKYNIDPVNKTEKSQTSKETVYTSKNNKNDTTYKTGKSGSIPVTNNSTQIEIS